jgi:hypothetical protein
MIRIVCRKLTEGRQDQKAEKMDNGRCAEHKIQTTFELTLNISVTNYTLLQVNHPLLFRLIIKRSAA